MIFMYSSIDFSLFFFFCFFLCVIPCFHHWPLAFAQRIAFLSLRLSMHSATTNECPAQLSVLIMLQELRRTIKDRNIFFWLEPDSIIFSHFLNAESHFKGFSKIWFHIPYRRHQSWSARKTPPISMSALSMLLQVSSWFSLFGSIKWREKRMWTTVIWICQLSISDIGLNNNLIDYWAFSLPILSGTFYISWDEKMIEYSEPISQIDSKGWRMYQMNRHHFWTLAFRSELSFQSVVLAVETFINVMKTLLWCTFIKI